MIVRMIHEIVRIINESYLIQPFFSIRCVIFDHLIDFFSVEIVSFDFNFAAMTLHLNSQG